MSPQAHRSGPNSRADGDTRSGSLDARRVAHDDEMRPRSGVVVGVCPEWVTSRRTARRSGSLMWTGSPPCSMSRCGEPESPVGTARTCLQRPRAHPEIAQLHNPNSVSSSHGSTAWPTRNVENLPGYESGSLIDQAGDGVGDVLGPTDPADRSVGGRLPFSRLEVHS